ncbi:MAG: trypsin-like peptidase domain-containing protein [Acidimicrobiia bacterium]
MHETDQLPIDWPQPEPTLVPESGAAEPDAPRPWFIPVVAGFLGATFAVAGVLAFDLGRTQNTITDRVTERVITELVSSQNVNSRAAAVALVVVPSVVTVELPNASGSGVILDAENGYIVTNEHVVTDAATVSIILSDGRKYEGEVLGTDILTDLAVVQIDGDGLTAIDLGSTEGLIVGDSAIAVGNPLGLRGGPTVTVGVLSAFDRQVRGDTPSEDLFGMIQTDAPFNRGSSGGALVDNLGRLIGITTALGVSDLGPEGLGFAIPVEVVSRVAGEIIATGSSGHAFLGIEGTTELVDLSDGAQAPVGVIVSQLLDGSSAGANGIRTGDVITTLDDQPVTTMEGLISILRRFSPDDQVTVGVNRNGETLTVVLRLGARES